MNGEGVGLPCDPGWSTDALRLLELHKRLCELDDRQAPREERLPVSREMGSLVQRIDKDELSRVLEKACREVTPEQIERTLARRLSQSGEARR